jgi:uncharacterized protein
MKDLLELVARKLVNNPDLVDVRETPGEAGSLLELRVAKEDLAASSARKDELLSRSVPS